MKTGLLIVALVAFVAGCTVLHRQGTTAPVFSELPPPAQLSQSTTIPMFFEVPVQLNERTRTNDSPEGAIHVGNILVVTFSNVPQPVATFTQLVRVDGTITLIYNKVFQAAGKKIDDLEKEIRDFYVPAYFTNLRLQISTGNCVYLDGEFRNPGRYPCTNGMTLKDAIEAAGGFTDFANNRITIIHSDGTTQRFRLRGDQALTNNPVLKQGDRIHNPRPIF